MTVGQIIKDNPKKDAIHVAIFPATAEHQLYPGQHVGIRSDGITATPDSREKVGIVDPFIRESVYPGQKFWLFLYPNTVTGMRHEWEHPAFSNDSRKIIEEIARDINVTYDEIIEKAHRYVNTGQRAFTNTESIWEVNWELFWKHFNILNDTHHDPDEKEFFSCAC